MVPPAVTPLCGTSLSDASTALLNTSEAFWWWLEFFRFCGWTTTCLVALCDSNSKSCCCPRIPWLGDSFTGRVDGKGKGERREFGVGSRTAIRIRSIRSILSRKRRRVGPTCPLSVAQFGARPTKNLVLCRRTL